MLNPRVCQRVTVLSTSRLQKPWKGHHPPNEWLSSMAVFPAVTLYPGTQADSLSHVGALERALRGITLPCSRMVTAATQS